MNDQEKILSEQAEKLGGGWRLDHGFLPIITLTTDEAALLVKKLERKPLAIKYTDQDHIERIIDVRDVTFIYSTEE